MYLAIDRTQWSTVNLLVVSLIYRRRDRGLATEEAWFILTNLLDLEQALIAYQKRMGIEEMFCDFKTGGYNLEGTQVKGERLISLTLLITLAYSCGDNCRRKNVPKRSSKWEHVTFEGNQKARSVARHEAIPL